MEGEDSFPRGKPKPIPSSNVKRRKPNSEEGSFGDSLFSERTSHKKEKFEQTSSKKRKTDDESSILKDHGVKAKDVLDEQDFIKVDFLHPKKVQEGMLLLGCIRDIHELELVVSLPHCNTGYIQATRISTMYNQMIQHHSEQESETNDELTPLTSMFHVGQLVVCSVHSLVKNSIQLTLEPSIINKYLFASSFFIGQIVVGAVKSEEDHGFVIDVGKNKINAFLPSKEATGAKLQVGCVIRSIVTEVRGEGSILLLSLDEKKINKAMIKSSQSISLDVLQPGMISIFDLKQKTKAGAVGKFLGFNASVCALDGDVEDSKKSDDDFGKKVKRSKSKGRKDNTENSDSKTDFSSEKSRTDKIKGCVLYVNPLVKHVCVGTNQLMMNKEARMRMFNKYEMSYPFGHKCSANVVRYIKGLGAIMQIGENTEDVGFCLTKHLCEEKSSDLDEFMSQKKQFPARVIQSLSLDGAVVLTLKKSIVESEFIDYDSIIVGSVVDCIIQSIREHGLFVSLGKTSFSPIRGFVPTIHLADVTLQHPEKKFFEGDVLSCKVLAVDKTLKRVKLTHKRTLIKSKLPTATTYGQLEIGDIIHGYIASIKSFGVFVNFYNNIHGLVPKSELFAGFVDHPEKVYFIGQVMKCRVINCDVEKEHLKLSFVLKPKAVDGKSISDVFKNVNVEVSNKQEDGMQVLIVDDDKPKNLWRTSFLPTMHLSDFPSLCHAWLTSLECGSMLKDCLMIGPKKVSRKKSIVESSKDSDGGLMNFAFSDLEEGLIKPGFVRHIAPYGVFVQLSGGLVGLCPKSKMADRFLLDTDSYYCEGQSVIAKVVEVDQEKKRFIVSLQTEDLPALDQSSLLTSYLQEQDEIMKLMTPSWPENYIIGSRIEVQLTEEKFENSVICKNKLFPKDSTARVIDVNEDNEKPKKTTTTLISLDASEKTILLSGDPKLLASGKKVKSGSVTMATVKYMNSDVTTVTIDKSKHSHLALTSTRLHPNHPTSKDNWPWKVAEKLELVALKCNKDGVQFLSAKPKDEQHMRQRKNERFRADSESSDVSCPAEVSFGNLQVGQEVEGIIKSVRKKCILVRVSESELEGGYRGHPVTGRLHISEMEDDPPLGLFPMKKFQPGNKIKCKVIGFRDVRTHHFLAITNRNATRCVLELSRRSPHKNLNIEDLKVGQSVTCFSEKYISKKEELHVEISPSVKGFISFQLLSDDPVHTLKAAHSFKKASTLHCIVRKIFHNSVSLSGKGAMIDCETRADVSELKENCVTNGRIRKIFESSLVLSLPQGGVGRVHITDVLDEFVDNPFENFEINQIVRCAIISCPSNKSLVLSLRKSHLIPESSFTDDIKDRDINDVKQLKQGDIVRGYVSKFSKAGVFVMLSRNIMGRVELAKASKYYIHDTTAVEEIFQKKLVQCKILGISQMEGNINLSLLECDTGRPDLVPEKLGLPLRHGKEKGIKRKEVGDLLDNICITKKKKLKQEKRKQQSEQKEKSKKQTKNEENRDSGLDDCEDFAKDILAPSPYPNIIPKVVDVGVKDPGFSWNAVAETKSSQKPAADSDSDDELSEIDEEKDEDVAIEVPKKKSRKEKEAAQEQEEANLREKEESLTNDSLPQTASDWDKLVLVNPQNSMLWVRYMAFHLHSTEIEKARAVAERAIKIIDFREEEEKWNVWLSLLNLENMFGTEDSLRETFDRATQHNDPLKVHTHMVSIFEKSGKFDEAEELCAKMIRKFRRSKNVWMLHISHLMQRGKREDANEILKRSLQSLEKNNHLEIISKFAQLEYKFGDPEQGRVMFENALGNFPKRSDVWSIYIDMLTKTSRIEEARDVYERVTTLNLSSKNMRTFFKRFIDFEQKFGTEENVSEVRQKAMDFIESKTNSIME